MKAIPTKSKSFTYFMHQHHFTNVLIFLYAPNSNTFSSNVIFWRTYHHSWMALLTSRPSIALETFRRLPLQRSALCIAAQVRVRKTKCERCNSDIWKIFDARSKIFEDADENALTRAKADMNDLAGADTADSRECTVRIFRIFHSLVLQDKCWRPTK